MFDKTRDCPVCGETIQYNTPSGYYNAKKYNSTCRPCWRKTQSGEGNAFFGKNHTEETKRKLSKQSKKYTKTKEFSDKVKEGMGGEKYGGTPYPYWLKKYGKEEADRRHAITSSKKSKNAKGSKNPMFGKPSPQGSGNGWKGWYNDIFFRSVRELMFRIELEETSRTCKTGESQKMKIQYEDYNGQIRNYFPDFIVDNQYMYEIKPKRLWKTPKVLAKRKAAEEFCCRNSLQYVMYDPIIETAKIQSRFSSGKIRWAKGYEEKFTNYILNKAKNNAQTDVLLYDRTSGVGEKFLG